MTKRLYSILLLATILVLCAGPTALATEARSLTPAQAQKVIAKTPGLVILDVRTPDEFRDGHIKGAINIDFYARDFQHRINELDKSVPYFVYCRSGRRSGVTIKQMQKTGFTNILHLENGINAWKDASLPLVR